jgi:hypothetical protein
MKQILGLLVIMKSILIFKLFEGNFNFPNIYASLRVNVAQFRFCISVFPFLNAQFCSFELYLSSS